MAAKRKRRKGKSKASKRLYEMGKWYDRKTGVVHEGPGTWVYRPGSRAARRRTSSSPRANVSRCRGERVPRRSEGCRRGALEGSEELDGLVG